MNIIENIQSLSGEPKAIFKLLYTQGPLTKGDIIEETGIKRTSLNRFIKSLSDLDLVTPTDEKAPTKGRPRITFDVNPKSTCIYGLDISRAYINLICTDLKNKILMKSSFPVTKSLKAAKAMEHIVSLIKQDRILRLKEGRKVLGLGLALVGPIDASKGMVLNHVDFPNHSFRDIAIAQELKDQLDFPIYTGQGAQLALLAEHTFGFAKNSSNCTLLNIGVGLRTGLMLENKLITSIPENNFDHISTNPQGQKCSCEKYGCLTNTATIKAIIQNLNQPTIKTYKDLKSHYKENPGHPQLEKAFQIASQAIAIAIVNYTQALNLETLIFMGPLCQDFESFQNQLLANVKSQQGKQAINISIGGHFNYQSTPVGASIHLIKQLFK